ncbi:hypothetical protein MASR1M45_12670 [Candidatus Kapaibacterium sp.]
MALHDIQLIQEVAGPDFVYRVLGSVASGKVFIINGSNLPELKALETSDITGLITALANKLETSEKGASNGLATLDGSGKVPSSQLPSSIAGSVAYQGSWNANTNTPTIPAASSTYKGHYYVVSVEGATNVDGITDWKVGDWIICNGTVWEKVDNTDAVTSVAGRTGAIVLAAGDIASGTLAVNRGGTGLASWTANRLVASTGATTLANLAAITAARALISDANGLPAHSSVTSTELGYLSGVTSALQTQLNGKMVWASPPASATASGTAGQIAYDNDYLYICVATNTWKRMPLATW